MRSMVAVILLPLLLASVVQGQSPFSSLLYTSSNISSEQPGPPDYSACQTDDATFSPGTAVSTNQLTTVTVNALWFGGSTTTQAASITVDSCSAIAVAGGRTVDIFSSSTTQPTISDCQITYFVSDQYLTISVNLTKLNADWSVSLPRIPSAIARTTCYGTRSECLLASLYPCTNIDILGRILPTYTFVGTPSPSGGVCPIGQFSSDQYGSDNLLYGLKATFYPGAFGTCQKDDKAVYTTPNISTLTPDNKEGRCQDGPDYTVPNSTFPSIPPLPTDKYSSCYAVNLDGYVNIKQNDDLQFLTPAPVPSFYNSYRVCLRFSNLVKLSLNNKLLIQSTTGDYDAALTCLDIPELPHGLVPFSLEYAVPPNGVDSVILQFYIIPVSQVTSDYRPGRQYQVSYKCDCCGLFSAGGSCCAPVSTCDYRTKDCGPLPTLPSPPPPLPPVVAPAPVPEYTPAPTPQSAPPGSQAPENHPPSSPPEAHPPVPVVVQPPTESHPPLPPPTESHPPASPPNEAHPPIPIVVQPPPEYHPPHPAVVPPTQVPSPTPIVVQPPQVYPPHPMPPTPMCPCPPSDKHPGGRRHLLEGISGRGSNSTKPHKEEFSFELFKEMVNRSVSWENLEAILSK